MKTLLAYLVIIPLDTKICFLGLFFYLLTPFILFFQDAYVLFQKGALLPSSLGRGV